MRAEPVGAAEYSFALFTNFFAIFAVKDFDRKGRKDRKAIL
jgi:hypothetical protein